MTRSPLDNFDHPSLTEGHPLRRHVLYRVRSDRWEASPEGGPSFIRKAAPGRGP